MTCDYMMDDFDAARRTPVNDPKLRTSVITDWHTKDEDLPDVAPGDEYASVSAAQKFIVLHRIMVRGMTLVHLEIGKVTVPFELENVDGEQRTYRLIALDDGALKKSLSRIGAAVATRDSIAIVPALEVRTILRNESAVPTKPRVALIVQEET